jgi:hypothetical protein
MVYSLGLLLESWSYYIRGNHIKILKINLHIMEKLQGLAPSVSIKDIKIIKGLILSREVFLKFISSKYKSI